MFSRFYLLIALASAVSLAGFAGCAKKALPTSTGGGLGGASLGCMDRTAEIGHRYFSGTVSEAEAGEVWDCAIESLNMFTEWTRGEQAGQYTPQELRGFLEKYFLTRARISDGFLAEVMELKRALIGGSTEQLTLSEISRAKRLFEVLRKASLSLRPYMPLTPARASRLSAAELESASAALRQAAREIGIQIEDGGYPYSFTRLSELLREFGAFDPVVAGRVGLIRENLNLLREVKQLLLGDNSAGVTLDGIAGDEWTPALMAGARWYAVALKLGALRDSHLSLSLSPGRDRFMELGREAVGLLGTSLGRHPRAQLPFAEIDRLLELLFPAGWTVGEGRVASLASIQAFTRPLIRRWLGGADFSATGRQAQGLTSVALDRLWQRIEHWNAGQAYIEALFRGAAQARRDQGRLARGEAGYNAAELSSQSISRLVDSGALDEDMSEDPIFKDAARRLDRLIDADRPLVFGDTSAISFFGAKSRMGHTIRNLTQMNLVYELARVLVSAYCDNPGRAKLPDEFLLGTTFPEFRVFISDIRALAIDLLFMDRDDPLIAEKRFREAALFTQASDGDAFFSVREGAQMLAFVFSGKESSADLHKTITASGCPLGGPDAFGYTLIETHCYRERYFSAFRQNWANMPKLVKFYADLSGSQRLAFQRSMETVARKKGYTDQVMMDSADTKGFVMVVHYVESIFARFDSDESGSLTWDEVETAFPVFKRSLEEVTCEQGHCLTSDKDLMGIFTYLLAYGEPPSSMGYVWWRYIKVWPEKKVNADRARLMQLFAQLSSPPSEK